MKLFSLLFLFLVFSLRAEDLYVTQTGTTPFDGTSAHPWRPSDFNTSGNWAAGAGKISAGDTVHLGGTISTGLVVQANGSAGNVITIIFDAGSKMSAGTWGDDTGAIGLGSHSYITVDGGSDGYIECTSNGAGLTTSQDTYGVRGSGASHIVVQNLRVNNIFVRARGTSTLQNGACITFSCGGGVYTDITVSNCVVHDAYTGIGFNYGAAGSCSTITVANCEAYNCNWTGKCSDDFGGSGGSCTGLVVHDCYFHNFTNWDGTDSASEAAQHHNAWYTFAENGGTMNTMDWYNNKVSYPFTIGVDGQTAGVFVSGSGVVGPLKIYNNVFLSNTGDTTDNGLVFVWPGSGCVTRVYNNTFVGTSAGIAIGYDTGARGSQTLEVKNNIVSGMTGVQVARRAGLTVNADHNDYYNLVNGQNFSWSTDGIGDFYTLAQWQGTFGFDTSGTVNTNPNLNGSYVPQPSSGAIDSGTSLSSYFTTDRAGLTRPQGSAWDMGAYEYQVTNTKARKGRYTVTVPLN